MGTWDPGYYCGDEGQKPLPDVPYIGWCRTCGPTCSDCAAIYACVVCSESFCDHCDPFVAQQQQQQQQQQQGHEQKGGGGGGGGSLSEGESWARCYDPGMCPACRIADRHRQYSRKQPRRSTRTRKLKAGRW